MPVHVDPRALFVLILCSAMISCREDAQDHETTPSPISTSADIEFDEKDWNRVGVTPDYGDLMRLSMVAIEYSSDDPRIRLLELRNEEGHDRGEGVFERILAVQRDTNGQWKRDGLCEEFLLDGSHAELEYTDGEIQIHHEWYADGTEKLYREYENGVEHGVHRQWYENGNMMFEVKYSDGVEIEGKMWTEDGTPR